jgi:hypothetical protein
VRVRAKRTGEAHQFRSDCRAGADADEARIRNELSGNIAAAPATWESCGRSSACSPRGATSRWTVPPLRLDEGSYFLIAATSSPDPAPHLETDLMAWVNGMSTRCTRSRLRM